MEGSGAAYDRAIQRLDEAFPEIATQIREEVARGQAVGASKLAASDIAEREVRMKDVNAGKIGTKDVAVVPYTDDERLRILLDALINLASTMASSRRSLIALIGDGRERVVEFVAIGADDTVTIDVAMEARNVEAAQSTVARLLEPVFAELEADA